MIPPTPKSSGGDDVSYIDVSEWFDKREELCKLRASSVLRGRGWFVAFLLNAGVCVLLDLPPSVLLCNALFALFSIYRVIDLAKEQATYFSVIRCCDAMFVDSARGHNVHTWTETFGPDSYSARCSFESCGDEFET